MEEPEEPESTAKFTPGSSFSMDDPVQYALSIHLVLRSIFRQFRKRKDLNSLLAVRAVCTLWWEEALDIMYDFSKLLPTISTTQLRSPVGFWMFTVNYKYIKENFNEFTERIKPSDLQPIGGMPLKLIVSEWTPRVVRFLKDRGEDIVSLRLCVPNSGGFSLEQESFRLENLRFASFQYSDVQDVGATSYHCKRFQDALILFLDLIKHAAHLEKCEVFLTGVRSVAASYQDGLAHLPLNLTKLATPLDCMENMARFQTWPRVNSLRLFLSPGNITLNSACITESANRLISLTLEIKRHENIPATLPRLRLPVLPKLTELGLADFGIHGDLPLPELMPQLKKVKITSRLESTLDVLSSLVTRDICHLNVTDFTLWEMGTLPNVNHVARMIAFARSFPNLVSLSVSSADFIIVATLPIIFSHLQRLKYLTLALDEFALDMDYDLVRLITGVSRENIPEDESTWPESLVGSPIGIANLTGLEEFTLRLIIDRAVTQRESKFMFKAAFLRMIHLKLIHFYRTIRFDRLENEVQEEWEAGGRVIRIRQLEDETENRGLEDDSDNEEGGWESYNEAEDSSDNEGEDDSDNEVRDQNENEVGGWEIDNEGEADSDNEGEADSDNEGEADSDNEGEADSDNEGEADSDNEGEADSDNEEPEDENGGRNEDQ